MRKQVRGTVTADRNDKTIRVVVDRRYQHPKYGKIVRGRTVCHTHDEKNEAKIGDVVEIVESRPRSALKRWELVRIAIKANQLQVAAVAESGDVATEEAAAVVETGGNQTAGGQSQAGEETSDPDSASQAE